MAPPSVELPVRPSSRPRCPEDFLWEGPRDQPQHIAGRAEPMPQHPAGVLARTQPQKKAAWALTGVCRAHDTPGAQGTGDPASDSSETNRPRLPGARARAPVLVLGSAVYSAPRAGLAPREHSVTTTLLYQNTGVFIKTHSSIFHRGPHPPPLSTAPACCLCSRRGGPWPGSGGQERLPLFGVAQAPAHS